MSDINSYQWIRLPSATLSHDEGLCVTIVRFDTKAFEQPLFSLRCLVDDYIL